MAVSLDQIDALLADWRTKIDRISQNLLDLYDNSTYQRLTGTGGMPPAQLTGTTQAQAATTLTDLTELFGHFELLANTVTTAEHMRQALPKFLGSEPKIQAIITLLSQPSIALPAIAIPLGDRDLLSASSTARMLAPVELLGMMAKTFQAARDLVTTVEAAWVHLEADLSQHWQQMASLDALAQSLNQRPESLDRLQAELRSLQHQIDGDPLGTQQQVSQHIVPLMAEVRQELETLAAQRQHFHAQLHQGPELLRQLEQLREESSVLFRESSEKVLNPIGLQPPISAAAVQHLADWLKRLQHQASLGFSPALGVGLNNWNSQIQGALDLAQQAVAANRAPLDLRNELRGRLQALKAKALAKRQIENATLTTLAHQADQHLYTRPTDLDQAAIAVKQYEQSLNTSAIHPPEKLL